MENIFYYWTYINSPHHCFKWVHALYIYIYVIITHYIPCIYIYIYMYYIHIYYIHIYVIMIIIINITKGLYVLLVSSLGMGRSFGTLLFKLFVWNFHFRVIWKIIIPARRDPIWIKKGSHLELPDSLDNMKQQKL